MTQDNFSDSTEQQRREIAATRDDMGRTISQIEDRVSPSRMKQRQTERMRSKWGHVRESVMGSSDMRGTHDSNTRQRMSHAAEGAQDAVQHAPERVESMTRGNPMAAGLIAVGLGALAGTMFPASRAERRLSSELRDEFEGPVREELQRSGKQVQSELQDHAQQAAAETKESAQKAMHHTKEQAGGSAQQLGDRAKEAGDTVRHQS